MKRYFFLAILLTAILSNHSAWGQLYSITNYDLDKGLPQSTVFSVYEDTRGYLWVGTESGVARFNGTSFKVFDRSEGLPGNTVRSITEDTHGNLWVGTENGVGVFNGHTWSQITASEGLYGTAVLKISCDSKGRMWVATNDAGVNIITKTTDSISIVNLNKDNGLEGNFVFDILHEPNGTSWLALIGGVNMVTFESNKPVISNLEDFVYTPSNLISCIDIDSNGNLWFGTLNAGAFQLIRSNNNFSIVPFDTKKGLVDLRIWDIFCDPMGRVWFGTNENGLYYWEDNHMHNITIKNGLPSNLILDIYKDRSNNLWFGSMNGLSLFHGFHFVHYTLADGLPGTQIFSVKADKNNNLWVGSDGKGLARMSVSRNKLNPQFFGSESGYTGKHVVSIDFDSDGTLLAATRGDGLAIYQNKKFNYIKAYQGLASDIVNCVSWNRYGSIYLGTNSGYNEIRDDKIYTVSHDDGLIHPEVETIISDLNDIVWMGTMGGLARFDIKTGLYRDFTKNNGLLDERVNALAVDKLNQIYIGTTNGIYRYNEGADTILPFLNDKLNARIIKSLLFYNDTILLAGTTVGVNKIVFNSDLSNIKEIKNFDKTNGFIFSETSTNAISNDNSNFVWLGTVNGLTRYNPQAEDTIKRTPIVHITGIRLAFEEVNWSMMGYSFKEWFNVPHNLKLKYYQNHITLDFDGLYLANPDKVRFRYKLEPHDKNWSPLSSISSITYPGLSDGRYSFVVSASVDGVNWSDPLVYKFVISPPFWKTIWFYLAVIALLVIVLIVYIRYRERKLKQEKEYLEQVVKERTAEVVAQKEHIQEQKEEITASITYACRIQQAILPSVEILKENTADSFVLFKPRDIVSGDFYWIGKNENKLIVTAADCTGHGVPGAFMSMLGISFLNKIVNEQKIEVPDAILGHMRSNIITSLRQGNYEGTTKDGMDMALCVIDLETLNLNFSGAYNPVVVISNNEATELKANRMPVGLHLIMDDFSSESIDLKKGDCVYMFSDGFQDQMGGPDGRKFMRKNLRELFLEIHNKPFNDQKAILEETIAKWRISPSAPYGEFDQIDDIVIVGFRF